MIGTISQSFVCDETAVVYTNMFSTVGMYALVAAALEDDIKRGRTVFLGAAVGFIISVRPSARNESDTTGRIFIKFGMSIFETMSSRFKFHQNLKRITGLYMEPSAHL